jgi:hypothetical protein
MVPIGWPTPDRQGARQFVINHVEPTRVPATSRLGPRLVWTGPDDRGVELEIVALDLPEEVIVIHVMPTDLKE